MVDQVFLSEILECAGGVGLSGQDLVGRVATDPAEITLRQYGRLWLIVAQEMQDEMLGLAANPLRPGSFALMCHSILGAPTLEKSIRRALWFFKVFAGSPFGVLTVRRDQAHITIIDDCETRSAFAYRTFLIVLLGPICWLARRRIPLLEVSFRCCAPEGAKAYSRLFGTPVQFGTRTSKVVISSEYMSLPNTRTEAALSNYLKQAPGNLLVGYQGSDDLTDRVREMLNRTPANEWQDFEHFSGEFGMSPSTLRRQLKAKGASYRSIKADVRFSKAKELLADMRLSVCEVADELGYAEPSAFFRAFQSWTGSTPARFRREQLDS